MTDLSPDRLDQALELMYYAFKRLVEAPDRLLERHDLARAHHRILYFVARRPGLTVGELLALLEVTKQSLNRPLRTLMVKGLVAAREDERDGRIRRLFLSRPGATLERRLTGMQQDHFAAVFERVGPERERTWREVMAPLGQG
ncbi:MAG: MarR family winged helix-turn-helix transcriptional regulator [Gemmatimonadales bacterium]